MLFSRGKKTKVKDEGQAKEAVLFQHIGSLQMELEWLKKSLSSSEARELRKLVDHEHLKPASVANVHCLACLDPPCTTAPHPSGSRLSLRIMVRIDALYIEDLCCGSLRMVDYLVREGIPDRSD